MTQESLNPYPQTIEEFQALRAMRIKFWKKLSRFAQLDLDRCGRRMWHDPEMRVYYAVTSHEEEPSEKMSLKMDHAETARQEYACYRHAKDLGFLVPEKHQLATRWTKSEQDEDSYELHYFGAVLSTSEVPGINVLEIARGTSGIAMSEEKRQRILCEAIVQGLVAGIVFQDFDRCKADNIILADIDEDNPQQFVHIDFEYTGDGSGHSLMFGMERRLFESYDMTITPDLWQEADRRLDDLQGRLMEPMPSLTRADKEMYAKRIGEGRAIIREKIPTSKMSLALDNFAHGVAQGPHVMMAFIDLDMGPR